MKQFLDTSGPATVVALNDHAYAVIKVDDEVQVVELCAPSVESGEDENAQAQKKDTNPSAVLSVVSKWVEDKKELLCAVSRYDKFISVYSISVALDGDGAVAGTVDKVDPVVVHKTNKRCCALTFTTIPYADESKGSLNMIVGGDLAGDVNAFPVVSSSSGTQQRLLLGHTASMITAVKVFDGKLFSADRDEKVRISLFPQTYKVEGYLLGNDSYVTDMDVFETENGNKCCVTASGDCTIKMWDYEKCTELSSLNVAPETNSESEEKDVEEMTSGEGSEGDAAAVDDDAVKQTTQIPVRVAANGKGSIVAVIYNDKNAVELFSVSSKGLEKMQSIECPNPLAITFDADDELCVLMKEPQYMMRFIESANGKYSAFDECKISSAVQKAGESAEISMPTSILEKDEKTGKLKLTKNIREEGNNYVEHTPWLNGDRVEKKKDKGRRHKESRRKRQKLEEEMGAN